MKQLRERLALRRERSDKLSWIAQPVLKIRAVSALLDNCNLLLRSEGRFCFDESLITLGVEERFALNGQGNAQKVT